MIYPVVDAFGIGSVTDGNHFVILLFSSAAFVSKNTRSEIEIVNLLIYKSIKLEINTRNCKMDWRQ